VSRVDLPGALVEAEGEGTVWTLRGSEDLNANLIRFDAGGGVGGHVNEEVDVLFVGVEGRGTVSVEGEEHDLAAGTAVFAPKGTRRSVTAGPAGAAYLSVHRRRGGPRIGRGPGTDERGGS